jgi:hypothetical protein
MVTWLRRLFWIALASGAGFAVYWLVQQRRSSGIESAPTPPPADTPTWVTPVDGICPEGYPIKVSTKSGIFHIPGGRSYERTAADRCYASADNAEADGYRQAKA